MLESLEFNPDVLCGHPMTAFLSLSSTLAQRLELARLGGNNHNELIISSMDTCYSVS